MSSIIHMLMVWALISILGALCFAKLDAYLKLTLSNPISLTYKNIRLIGFLLVNFIGFYCLLFIHHQPFWFSFGVGLFNMTVCYILFELLLNKFSGEVWYYISDDGVDHSTSWDDLFFIHLSDFIWNVEGQKFSGKFKFLVKIILLIISILLIVFNWSL